MLVALALLVPARRAHAQLEPLEDGISVGAWTFFPTLELRLRGEYRRSPVDTGGDVYERVAVQADGFRSASPAVIRRDPSVGDQWLVSERARLGLMVQWQLLRADVVLQDARVWGVAPGAPAEVDAGGLGSFAPHEAWLDVRDDAADPIVLVRLGRQTLQWGDGRLVGDSDWAPRGGSLDAALLRLFLGPVDVSAMGALLAPPGHLPPDARNGASSPEAIGSGAQLYGLDAAWPIVPLFGVELTTLARVARDPLPSRLTPSDTFTLDGRVFGDHRGVRYGVEGAYQLGTVEGFGVNRDVRAFAAAGAVEWQTALPGAFRFAARGAYASGDDSNGQESGQDTEKLTRFDPIAPDVHDNHGLAGLYAWSNLIEGAGEVSARPVDELLVGAGYAFVGLAEPNDRWTTASLVAVGAAPDNTSRVLGHELDVRVEVVPWAPLHLLGGYGLMVLGDGGRSILALAGRGDPKLLHYGVLEVGLVVP